MEDALPMTWLLSHLILTFSGFVRERRRRSCAAPKVPHRPHRFRHESAYSGVFTDGKAMGWPVWLSAPSVPNTKDGL